ncbi:hypothetical protein SO802_008140 [Lithocarpus litseifolius]|uniref:FAR1 domain-containing protein n=1 Tax=Lithocarpus litseifolius TaxID=425828 RepID=A0AAW2DAG6_9ROSI
MEEEITSGFRLVELNEHNSDNKMKDTMDLKNNELNENNVENEKEETRKVEDRVEDPCVGLLFGSIDDIKEYFTRYGNKKGFAVAKRTSRKGNDGEVESLTVACNHAGKQQIKASNSLKAQPQSKTGCKAHFNMIRCLDGWILKSMELEHNHGLSPSKTRFYKCNRVLKPHVRGQLELNAKVGIKMNKNFNSLVVEAGGHENLPFLEKDCRNHLDRVKRLELGEGDAVAMNKYFLKMQADNSNFFYMIDFTEDGRLKNVFWADARSREAFKEFGDVITTKVENVSCTTPTMGLRVLGVQKSFNLNEAELQQSQQIGKESYEESPVWPNINCPPNIIGMSPYYGLPNMLQGGNSPFQSSMIRQVVGMQPFSYHENTSQACTYLLCFSYDKSPLQKACYDLSNEHPSNSIGKFGTNDVTKVGSPKLQEDGRGN